MTEIKYKGYERIEVPNDWEPIEHVCYPGNGSKAFTHPETGATTHLIEMGSGERRYIAQFEHGEEWYEEKWISYEMGVAFLESWMESSPTPQHG